LEQLSDAAGLLEARGQLLYGSFVCACVADAFVTAGNLDRAEPFARRALQRAEKQDRLGESAAYRALARIYWRRGPAQRERANAHLNEAFQAARARGSNRELALTELLVAELRLDAGARETAAEIAEKARAAFERMRMPWYEAQARRIADLAAT
jgi:hypothetical protein